MAQPYPEAFLNGDFVPLSQARIPVLDRGFLFGDSIYEVIPVYGGVAFRLTDHLRRLARSLTEIQLDMPHEPRTFKQLIGELVRRNGGGNMAVYLQVTRGADIERDHAIPAQTRPTVFAMATPMAGVAQDLVRRGVAAIVRDDLRWARCDIKANSMIATVLARSAAEAAGATEAILVRGELVTEGAASSIFVVHEGAVATPPDGPLLLASITREVVLELAARHGIPATRRAVSLHQLRAADEIWICSSTREILPVTRLDGERVGTGQPGPVWHRVFELFQAHKAQLIESAA